MDTPEVKTSYQYVFKLRERLGAILQLTRAELESAQSKEKKLYDIKRKPRKFRQEERVLLLLPTDHSKLLMQWKGPYEMKIVVSLNDYRVKSEKCQKHSMPTCWPEIMRQTNRW